MNPLSKLKDLFSKKGAIAHNPSRDWLMLVSGAALFLVVSVLWNVWFFNRIVEEGPQAPGTGSETLDAYEAGALRAILDARSAEAEAYRSTYPFIDPSR